MKTITLKDQVNILTKAAGSFKTLPILATVRITNEQKLEATNLSTTVTVDGIGGMIDGFIDAKILKRGGLDGALANWDAVKNTEFTAEDWPELPTPDAANIELNQATISAMIEALAAVGDDNSRPVLAGIRAIDGAITSTDGYRLFSKGTGHGLDALIPRQVAELIKLSKTLDGWHYGESDNQMTFKNGGLTIVSRKIDGNYPEYKPLIPTTTDHRVTLETAKLFDAVKLLDGAPSVHITTEGLATVESDGRSITIEAARAEGGHKTNPNDVHIIMPLKQDKADGVSLNPRYIKDAIGKYKYIRIDFSGKFNPTDVHGINVLCN